MYSRILRAPNCLPYNICPVEDVVCQPGQESCASFDMEVATRPSPTPSPTSSSTPSSISSAWLLSCAGINMEHCNHLLQTRSYIYDN